MQPAIRRAGRQPQPAATWQTWRILRDVLVPCTRCLEERSSEDRPNTPCMESRMRQVRSAGNFRYPDPGLEREVEGATESLCRFLLRQHQPGVDDRIGIERYRFDALVHQPLGQVRM